MRFLSIEGREVELEVKSIVVAGDSMEGALWIKILHLRIFRRGPILADRYLAPSQFCSLQTLDEKSIFNASPQYATGKQEAVDERAVALIFENAKTGKAGLPDSR